MTTFILPLRDLAPSISAARLRRRSRALAAAAMMSFVSLPALASDRWEEAGGGAVAILPVPTKATAITGGSLSCAEQRWSFRLRIDADAPSVAGAEAEAVVKIDDASFTVNAQQAAGVVTIAIPYEALDDLKTGTRLSFSFGKDKAAPAATFSLRFSKQVIEAIAPRCSQIDMTGYDRVAMADTGAAVDAARPLLAGEIEIFRTATNSEPAIAAASIDLPDQRAMLFSSLCGSTWYYGRTGCTFAAFARLSATAPWQEVYNSEGVAMYTDPKAGNDGWPNLVTLPLVGGTEATHWVWTGSTYELADHAVAGDDLEVEGQGDLAQ